MAAVATPTIAVEAVSASDAEFGAACEQFEVSAVDDLLADHELDTSTTTVESLRSWRELSRLRSDLAAVEEDWASTLREAAHIGDEGTVPFRGGSMAARIRTGRNRDDWAHETLWSHVEDQALARSEADPTLSPERSVTDTARHYLGAGGYRNDGLRGMGLKPSQFATYTERRDDNGERMYTLVPVELDQSSPEEEEARNDVVRSFLTPVSSQDHDDEVNQIAERLYATQQARLRVDAVMREHEARLRDDLPADEASTFAGVGTVANRAQGSWSGWDHDAVWNAMTKDLEARAPLGVGPKARHGVAVERLRAAVGDTAGWKKRPLAADGLLDSTYVSRSGRVSVSFE